MTRNHLEQVAMETVLAYKHDPPEPAPSHIPELVYDYSDSQIPAVDYWS